MSKKNNAEPRFTSDDWDSPHVSAKFSGKRDTMRRKVITKGICRVNVGKTTMDEIEAKLRQGYEVRINDAIRLYPCVETDYKTMFVAGATIGTFRQLLSDKKVKITHRGKDIDAEEADATGKRHHAELKQNEATPDMIVTCPRCGTRFRVGHRLSA